VRLASKLVGWDIEIMTSEELDELIEKAVNAFTKIEEVDTELAEKLVEQGILSYDDLSVMEISDLVNTIDGLTEEQAVAIVSRAETLAEEQAEELPRRKGGRPAPPPVEVASAEDAVAPPSEDEAAVAQAAGPNFQELFGGDERAEDGPEAGDGDEAEIEAEAEESASEESAETGLRDLDLAAETSGRVEDGHEVTSPPSDADQDETNRIVTEAVASGVSPRDVLAHDESRGSNGPPPTPTEPISTDEVEGRDAEMQHP
jgi:N utilization substance protein A